MCESTFIPLEKIRDLLAEGLESIRDLLEEDQINIELTPEEYIILRKDIEADERLTARLVPATNFDERLINYGNQQIHYTNDNIVENLREKYIASIPEILDLKEPQVLRELRENREKLREIREGLRKSLRTIRERVDEGERLEQERLEQERLLQGYDINPSDQQKKQMQKLENYLVGYYATWIIDIGLKAGLFTAISQATASQTNTAISAEDLSRQLGLSLLYVQVWCRAAHGFELLDIVPSKGYRLVPDLDGVLLDATNPNNMRFDIEFGTVLHQDFAEFPTYLRTGKTWPLADRPGEIQRLYVEATLDDYPVLINVLLPRMAPEILTRLRQNQGEWQDNGPPSILDVGTGAGFALVYYAKQFPNAHITGLDINHSSVEQAKHNIVQAANLQNNHIQVHEGDVTKLKDEPKYDLIIINLALHEIALPDYPHLFDLLYNALRPGGILLISDYHFPNLAAVPTYRYPGYQLLLSLLLHLALVGNTLVPSQKVIELLKAKFPGEGNVAETHHPIEERKVIVAKKV